MKKTLLSCLTAVAAASVIFAASDKINLFQGGYLAKMLNVEEVDHISWSNPDGVDEGYTHFDVDFKNGTSQTFVIDELDGIEYQQSRGDCPVTMEVTPRYQSAQLQVTAEPGIFYRITGMPEKMLTAIDADESIWGELLMQNDVAYIYAVAEQTGRPLSSFGEEEVFEFGSQTRDWFPPVTISDNTPIAMVVYTARLDGDEVVVTSDPTLIRFTTRKLEMEDVAFDITTEMTSNSLVVKVDAPETHSDMPFFVTAFPKDEVDQNGLDYLAKQTAYSLENMVYNYGISWDEATFRGHGENSFSNLLMGDQYYAVAFGIDYGIVNTVVKAELVTIPAPEIVDDCRFDVTATQKSPAEFLLEVTPSSPDTRYAALLVEKSKLTDTNTPAMAIASKIKFLNYTNTIDWNDTELVFTGAATLSTHDDMLDGMYLNTGTEYSILIFGIDEKSHRTTEIKQVDVTPQSVVSSGLSFDISFSDFDGSNKWSHMLTATVTPSDPDSKYVFAYLPADNSAVDLSKTDEELMSGYVAAQGEWLKLHSGDLTQKMSFSSKYDSSAGGNVFKPYVLIVFGYDGEPTSQLYAYTIDTETGEVEQVRGPQPEQQLSFTITPGEFNGSNRWSHYLPLTITPSDLDAKYVVDYLYEGHSAVNPDKTDQEWIDNYIAGQGEWLTLNSGVLEKTLSFSSKYDSSAGGYVFKPYILFIFGYDGEATSPLYVYRVNTDDGTMEQLRGPGM
ncbi:MAG: hypothetical protein K2L39_05215 [Muribaculaceae bacterium]|nr:hypothetical protein [Muribaculaceae bacterium]